MGGQDLAYDKLWIPKVSTHKPKSILPKYFEEYLQLFFLVPGLVVVFFFHVFPVDTQPYRVRCETLVQDRSSTVARM